MTVCHYSVNVSYFIKSVVAKVHQECLTYAGLASLNLSIFIVNNFYCVINCLNMNRVIVCRAKSVGIAAYRHSFTDELFPLWLSNSEEKITKFPFPKMKLNRINASFPMQVRENDRFLKIFLSIYLKRFTYSFQSFTKCSSAFVA